MARAKIRAAPKAALVCFIGIYTNGKIMADILLIIVALLSTIGIIINARMSLVNFDHDVERGTMPKIAASTLYWRVSATTIGLVVFTVLIWVFREWISEKLGFS